MSDANWHRHDSNCEPLINCYTQREQRIHAEQLCWGPTLPVSCRAPRCPGMLAQNVRCALVCCSKQTNKPPKEFASRATISQKVITEGANGDWTTYWGGWGRVGKCKLGGNITEKRQSCLSATRTCLSECRKERSLAVTSEVPLAWTAARALSPLWESMINQGGHKA